MKSLRAKLLATGIILASVAGAGAANLSLLSGSAFSEPSQILNTLNTLIQSINIGTAGLVAQTQSPIGTIPLSAQNAATLGTEQALNTLTIPGGQLTANGQSLRARCFGTLAANNNTKQVRLFLYQTTTPNGALISSLASTVNGGSYELELVMSYNTATTQTWMGRGTVQNQQSQIPASAALTALVTPIVATTAVINFANAITAQCNAVTGAAGSNSPADITGSELIVEQIK